MDFRNRNGVLKQMKPLTVAYEHITEPCNIREQFDYNGFVEWLREGSIGDLQCTLIAFENSEMYEDCIIIKQIINEKKN